MSCARPCALESVALHQNDASKNHAPYLPLEDVIEWTSFFLITPHLAILLVTFLGWLNDLFKWLSDLQLGDEKVTKNHLAYNIFVIYPKSQR